MSVQDEKVKQGKAVKRLFVRGLRVMMKDRAKWRFTHITICDILKSDEAEP